MTLLELETEVFRALGENAANPVYWSKADIDAALNEGLEHLAEHSEYNELNEAVNLQALTTYYDLSTLLTAGDRLLRVTRVWNPQVSMWMEPVTVRELDEETYPQWERTPGEPQKWFVRGLWNLGVFPRVPVAAGTIQVHYAALPAPLALAADTPGFPQEFHRGLIEYALYDLTAQDGETQKALSHYNQFLEYQAGLTNYVRTRMRKDRVGVIGG